MWLLLTRSPAFELLNFHKFKTCHLTKLLATLSEIWMLLQCFQLVRKNLCFWCFFFIFFFVFFYFFIKRMAFMPRTPFMKNVSLARSEEKQLQNKETRLTQSMTVLTNSTASLGTQVRLLRGLPIHSLVASKAFYKIWSFFFEMAGSQ